MGKICYGLGEMECNDGVMMLDEIDKLAHRGGQQGDIQSCLLEVLDKEQNHSFIDSYLDVPVDLSKITFICTANSLNNIT